MTRSRRTYTPDQAQRSAKSAEGAQVMPDQRVLGLVFRRHRRRLGKPIIHTRERDLRSLARTEAHEAPYHGRPDELPRGVGPLRLVSPPSVHPVFRLRPEPLRQIAHELGPGQRAALEGVEDHSGGLFLLQTRSLDPPLLSRQPRRHETAEIQEEFVRGQEVERPPHRPRFDDRPLLFKGSLHIVDGQISEARPQGDPRHGGDLSLDSAHVSDDVREVAARGSEVEMVSVQTERRNLGLGEGCPVRSVGHVPRTRELCPSS